MAPITDETVEALRDTIHKLESRVHQLEARLGDGSSGAGKAGGPLQSIRMILMGPPGAGKAIRPLSCWKSLRFATGKGTQAPKIQQKYCACHLVCFSLEKRFNGK